MDSSGPTKLRDTSSDDLAAAVRRHNANVRAQFKEALHSMDAAQFEELIGELMRRLGFENVLVSQISYDGGVDVKATLVGGGITNTDMAVQVKRWRDSVGPGVIQQLRGSLESSEQGLVVTLSDFTKGAREEAVHPQKSRINLIDGGQLVGLLMQEGLGVKQVSFDAYALDPEFGFGLGHQESMMTSEDVSELNTDDTGTDYAVEPQSRLATGQRSRPQPNSLWIWPLPGGISAYKTTLDQMAEYIAEQHPTVDEVIPWMRARYPSVESAGTIRHYFRVLTVLGLSRIAGNHYELTVTGAEYLKSKSSNELLDLFKLRIAGVSEILDSLSNEPMTEEQLLSELKIRIGVTWQTTAQVGWRLKWLKTLDATLSNGSYWLLNSP